MINICEIFKSIQGESTYAGLPCSFIRLSGCNLSCCYCDTRYASEGGTQYSIEELCAAVDKFQCSVVEITGGEPLLQSETPVLCEELLLQGHTVLVETNGSLDISVLPHGCITIMDIKCPGSGCGGSFLQENLSYVKRADECKFVISDREDFDWALAFVKKHSLHTLSTVLFSPRMNVLEPRQLVEWILAEHAPVRLNLQIHRLIWGNDVRGV